MLERKSKSYRCLRGEFKRIGDKCLCKPLLEDILRIDYVKQLPENNQKENKDFAIFFKVVNRCITGR